MRVWVFRASQKSVWMWGALFLFSLSLFYNGLQPSVFVTGVRLVPIYRVKTEARSMAISFDATWGTELTDELLQILKEHNVRTTFFLAGNWIEKHPDYVVKIASFGHEIGNHSYSHPHMSTLSEKAITEELRRVSLLILELTGTAPFLFRPPFGEYNNLLLETAKAEGYYTIQWSIDSLDWKHTTAEEIYTRVMGRVGPGEIVLFHNAAKQTPQALRRLLPDLKEKGYSIVPLSELIYRTDYIIRPDGTQEPSSRRQSL